MLPAMVSCAVTTYQVAWCSKLEILIHNLNSSGFGIDHAFEEALCQVLELHPPDVSPFSEKIHGLRGPKRNQTRADGEDEGPSVHEMVREEGMCDP